MRSKSPRPPRPRHMIPGILLAALLAPLGSGLLAPRPATAQETAYKKEIEAWYAKRNARLQSKTGWLTLAGLFPLREGKNSLGTAPDNVIVTPRGTPEHMGSILIKGDRIVCDVAVGVEITTVDGKPVRTTVLTTDEGGATPTVLRYHSFRLHVISRAGSYYVRLRDEESALLKNFSGVDRYPVDPAWRVVARFEPFDTPRKVSTVNVLGAVFEETCPGALVFEIGGETYRLYPVYEDGDESQLFMVFGDETNGEETYGGGRQLYAPLPGDDGTLVVDFNLAFNLPCAFTPYSTCPLPRDENRLPIRVTAGEKRYGERHR